jgi:hypothetical protein
MHMSEEICDAECSPYSTRASTSFDLGHNFAWIPLPLEAFIACGCDECAYSYTK